MKVKFQEDQDFWSLKFSDVMWKPAIAIVSIGQKEGVKRSWRWSVKIWEFDNDVYHRDTTLNSCTDEWSDSLRPTGISSMHSCSAALCLVSFHSSVRISIFVFTSLPDQLKKKNDLGQERIVKHKGFWKFVRKFHHEINRSKLPERWLAQLSIQLKPEFVDGVCLRRKRFFQRCFLE